MKVEKKELGKSIIELIVEASVKEVAKYRNQALKYISDNTEIQGFRKGSIIPENILVKKVWETKVSETTINFAIDDLYKKALLESKIIPVAQGEIKEIISENPLKIKIHIEVLPEVTINIEKIKKIHLTRKKVSVSTKEVSNAIADIETKFTKFEETSKKAKMWDKVTIDTDGHDKEWKVLETTSMRAYPLVLGTKLLVSGFEEGIVWKKTWEEFELDITFPKDYHNKDFAELEIKFKVKILKIEASIKPEFTREFIEQLRGQKLDMEGFKKLIKSEILDVKTSNQNIENELKLIDELLKVSKLEIGEKMISEQTSRMFTEIKENMLKQNIKMKDYLESLKLDEETYKLKHIQFDATKRLQGELILNKLVEILNPEISDKQVILEVEKIKKAYQNLEVLKRLDEMYKEWTRAFEELKIKMKMKSIIDSFYKEEVKK